MQAERRLLDRQILDLPYTRLVTIAAEHLGHPLLPFDIERRGDITLGTRTVPDEGEVIEPELASTAVVIRGGCSGIEALLLMLAGVLALPAPWSLRLRTLARDLPLLFGLNLLRILALSLYDGPASRLDRRRPRPDRPGGDGHRRPSAVDATRGSRATASTRGVGRGSTQLIMRWVAAFIGASLFIATMQSAWIEYLLGRLAVAFAQLAFGSDHPFYVWIDGADLAWRSGSAAQGSIGLRLLSYHLGLYLTAAIAVKHVRARQRLEWCAAALPVLLLWQIGDVLLGIESQWLTLARPSGYDVDVAGGLDLWFLLVKVANNFNVLAARQLVPLAILWAQWSRWQAQEQVRQGHPEDPPA